MPLPEPRYVATEIQGYPIRGGKTTGSHPPGISCQVLDRHENYRLVATYMSEDRGRGWRGGGHDSKRFDTSRFAAEHAERLNRGQ
jgi:hypothetical protein